MKIFSKVPFSLVGFLYIIVAGSLCYILPVPEIIKGFLALPGFLIIPYLVGNILLFQIKKLLDFHDGLDFTSNFVLGWLLGLVTTYFIYSFFWLFNINNFMIFMGVLFGFMTIINIYQIKCSNNFFNPFITKDNILVLFLLIVIFLSYALSHYIIPIADSYGQYTHVFIAYSFLMDVYSKLYSNEDGYLPYIPLLYATNSVIFNISPVSLMPLLPFLLIFIFIGGAYKFVFQVTKNKQIAIISVILSIWTFDVTGYFKFLTIPIPKNLLFSVFPWILFIIQKHFLDKYNNEKTDLYPVLYAIFLSIILFIFFFISLKLGPVFVGAGVAFFSFFLFFFYKKLSMHKNIFLLLGVVSFILISIHIYEGPLFVFLMFVYILSYIFLNNKEFCEIFNKIMIVCVCGIFLFFLLRHMNILQFKETALLSKYVFPLGVSEEYEISFHDKYQLLLDATSVTIWCLFLIGFAFAFLSKLKFIKAVAFSSIIMYFFYFFPENQFIRASIGQSIPFFSIIISFGLWKMREFFNFSYYKHPPPTIFCFITIFLIFIAINGAVEMYLTSAEKLYAEGRKTQVIEDYEKNAFRWIALNTPKDSIIFTDPYTSNFIKTNSFRSNYFRLIWPATEKGLNQTHVYMDEMKKIFSIKDAKEMHAEMIKVKREIIEQRVKVAPRMILFKEVNVDSPLYIVVSGRTCKWLNSEKRLIVSYTVPTNFRISEECINKFDDTKFFEKVYQDDDKIFVFKVKP